MGGGGVVPRGGVGGGLWAPLGGGKGGGSPLFCMPGEYCLFTGGCEFIISPFPTRGGS